MCRWNLLRDFQQFQTASTCSYPRLASTHHFLISAKSSSYRNVLFVFVCEMYRLSDIGYEVQKCYPLIKLLIIWLCLDERCRVILKNNLKNINPSKGSDLAAVIIWCHLDWFRLNCMVLAVKQHTGLYTFKMTLIGCIFNDHIICR